MREVNLMDYVHSVALWPSWAIAPEIPPLGDPIATGDGTTLTVPPGVEGRCVLVALAADGTPLVYWRMTVAPGERLSVA